ncbi:diguanylate cyclase, partial [Zoogloea sp.]|uniref:diguanylate cyclase domain-containing protein n=1 Tax=Zoogloea sp. TaxID=49181 RepID=UPI0025EAD8BE
LVAAIADIPDDICPGNPLGASIGIASYPRDGYDLHQLLSQADRAMYAAKQAGGSRWKLA